MQKLDLIQSRLFERICYGFGRDKKGIVYIDDEQAKVVKMIFQYAIDGNSLEKIQNLLLEKDVPSPSGNKKWSRAAIDKLLNNIKYFERIIPDEDFFKAYHGKIERSTHFNMSL